LFYKKQKRAGCCKQLCLLNLRNSLNLVKNPMNFRARVGQTIFIAVLCMIIFWQMAKDFPKGVFNRAGCMFFVCINQTMLGMFGTLMTFEMERPVFLREYGDKSYGIIPFFLSKTMIDLPFMFIFPTIFSAMVYFAFGFGATFTQWLFYDLTLCLLVTVAASYGMFFSAAFKNLADVMAPLCMMPLILFGGFFANAGTYPDYVVWI
jgi:ABC-type multidrug transport system permease subunit